jgi:hypothetical protein
MEVLENGGSEKEARQAELLMSKKITMENEAADLAAALSLDTLTVIGSDGIDPAELEQERLEELKWLAKTDADLANSPSSWLHGSTCNHGTEVGADCNRSFDSCYQSLHQYIVISFYHYIFIHQENIFEPHVEKEAAKITTTQQKSVRPCANRVTVAASTGRAVGFISATGFNGHKPGHVFKQGDQGLGYYQDKSSSIEESSEPPPLTGQVPRLTSIPTQPQQQQQQPPPVPPPLASSSGGAASTRAPEGPNAATSARIAAILTGGASKTAAAVLEGAKEAAQSEAEKAQEAVETNFEELD